MGEVVEAEHIALAKRVVVKILHRRFSHRPDLVARLRCEGRALAHLAHPNIVTVSDLQLTPDGRPYLVMERLYGRTLRAEREARGSLPVAEAVAIVRQALAGLAAAHNAGMLHRDIKQENSFP
jgi:serine/threonine-protein kinase